MKYNKSNNQQQKGTTITTHGGMVRGIHGSVMNNTMEQPTNILDQKNRG
jgi:hypothetical protein